VRETYVQCSRSRSPPRRPPPPGPPARRPRPARISPPPALARDVGDELHLAPSRRVRRRRVAPAEPLADLQRGRDEPHAWQGRSLSPSRKPDQRDIRSHIDKDGFGDNLAEERSDVPGVKATAPAAVTMVRRRRRKVTAPLQQQEATDVQRVDDIPPAQVEDVMPAVDDQRNITMFTNDRHGHQAPLHDAQLQRAEQGNNLEVTQGFMQPGTDDSYSYSYSDSEYSDDGAPNGASYGQLVPYWGGHDPYAAMAQGKGGLEPPPPPPGSFTQELEPAPGVFDLPPIPNAQDPYAVPRRSPAPPPPHYGHMGYMMPGMGTHTGQPPGAYPHMPPQAYSYGYPPTGSAPVQDKEKGKGKGKKGKDGEGKGDKGKKGSKSNKGKGSGKQSRKGDNYKTRMCPQFENGECRRGDECTYAHSTDELRKAPNDVKA